MTRLEPQPNCIGIPLAAARQGDGDAFSTLVSPHTHRLQRLARRLTRNAEDAEDICQQSLLKAYTKLDQFAGERTASDEFRAWLMRITANCAIDFLRRKEASKLMPLDECENAQSGFYQAGSCGWGESPEVSCSRQERVRMVVDALAELPTELRNVCLLRNMMELSTKEVAERLGISKIAVRVRLFRAHGQLREILSGRGVRRRAGRARRLQSAASEASAVLTPLMMESELRTHC